MLPPGNGTQKFHITPCAIFLLFQIFASLYVRRVQLLGIYFNCFEQKEEAEDHEEEESEEESGEESEEENEVIIN